MLMDHMTLADKLKDYASPRAKITRMIRSGEVIQIRRGLFIEGSEAGYSLRSLASAIYGPSYISFEYALSFYGLIPERAGAVTSAIYDKNKNKRFHTPIGDFYYYYLPRAVFPYGIARNDDNGQGYLIATPEKALCDSLYKARGVDSIDSVKSLLFNEWRMDEKAVAALNRRAVSILAPLYRRRPILLFAEWMKKEASRA